MPELDRSLIDRARHFTTGANVHAIKTWIFCYETSAPGTLRRERYERLLRDFVRARELNTKMQRLVEKDRQLVNDASEKLGKKRDQEG